MRRAFLLLLLAALLATAVPALGGWQEWMDRPVSVSLSVRLDTRLPLDAVRTGQLNDLLKHMSLRLTDDRTGSTEQSAVGILVDGREVLSAAIRDDGMEAALRLSPMPGRLFRFDSGTGAGEMMALLLGAEEPDDLMQLPELSMLAELEALLPHLEGWLEPYAVSSVDHTRLGKAGTAARKVRITLTGEDASALPGLLTAGMGSGPLKTLLGKVRMSGKQTVTLLMDENDRPLRLVWSGQAAPEGGRPESCSLQWTLGRGEGLGSDSLIFRYGEAFSLKLERDRLNLNLKLDRGKGKQKTSLALETELTAGDESLQGRICLTATDSGGKRQLSAVPEITDGRGTVDFSLTEKGTVSLSGTLFVTVEEAEAMAWETASESVRVDRIGADGLLMLREEVSSALARELLRPLVLLPQEDTLYLSADLNDEQWQAIRDAAAAPCYGRCGGVSRGSPDRTKFYHLLPSMMGNDPEQEEMPDEHEKMV